MIATIDQTKCDRCGTCIGVCPANALLLLSDRLVIDPMLCTGCGTCAKICPFAALAIGPATGR
jgi:heterodisulfide reductase subunit A